MDTAARKYYFTADVHMGSKDDPQGLLEREFVEFLHSLPQDAKALYLLGDIFDFWVDYKEVVPRGHVRTLAALAELVERGVEVFFYPGNHDWWVTDYFEKELGVRIVRDSCSVLEIGGQRICVGHGDMPGASDFKSRFLFRLFRNRFCIAMMKALPTRWSFAIAHGWSASSRKGHPGEVDLPSTGLYEFADNFGRKRKEAGEPPIDLYVFGHIHTPARVPVPSGGELLVLGDWSRGPRYFCI
jgi:UDP-2,3-diacylglucosamine hydrolase